GTTPTHIHTLSLHDALPISILISTHILPDVRSTCDSVVILAKGRVRVAERLEVLSRPRSPSMHVRLLGHPEAFLDRARAAGASRSEEHTSELQSREKLVCRL